MLFIFAIINIKYLVQKTGLGIVKFVNKIRFEACKNT